jgi:polyhydroxyalkanoate synthase
MIFGAMDAVRRRAGRALDAIGLGANEAPFRTIAEMRGGRLRAYGPTDGGGPAVLLVPAPFKRPYLWDLLPQVSVVRRCLEAGLRVHLLEWTPPTRSDSFGLADYADRLPAEAVDAIGAETGAHRVVVAGHSLGGTLAAIFASLHPEVVTALVLLDAPLAFGEQGGPLARAVAATPRRLVRTVARRRVAGTLIDLLCVGAAPHVFQWQRWSDLVASLASPAALAIHARVERWALDEFPLPGRLFEDLVEQLYRDDRFRSGTLDVGGRRTGVDALRAPVLAVVNPAGRIVPPESLLAALERAPRLPLRVLTYRADRGPVLQHLGPLVARGAHERLWPEILAWIESCR